MDADTRKAAGRTAERQIAWQRWLGLLCCAAGFAVIGIGWAGAAKLTCVDCQLPYLLSGGAVGLGLIVFGIGMLVMAQVRTEGRRWAARLEQAFGARSLSAGSAAPGSLLVVVGRSTYHRPDCRLIAGKSDLPLMPLDAARMQGMSPCRVCDPDSTAPVEEASAQGAPTAETVTPSEVVPAIIARAHGDEDLSRAEREAFGSADRSEEGTRARADRAPDTLTPATVTTEDHGPAGGSWLRRRRPRRR